MSNDNRKSPFSDLTEGDEEDWDKALNAWELPSDAAPEKKDQAAVPPKPANPAVPAPPRPPPAPPAPPKRPPIEVPRPGIPTPTAPPMSESDLDEVPRANFES